MASHWDPRTVFSIHPQPDIPLTCVGIAKSKPSHPRCMKSIGQAKRIQAGRLLDDMSRMRIAGRGYDEAAVREKMKDVLEETLCYLHKKRGNYSQFQEVEKEWWEKLKQVRRRHVEAVNHDARVEAEDQGPYVQRRRSIQVVAPQLAQPAAPVAHHPDRDIHVFDRIRFLEERRAQDEAQIKAAYLEELQNRLQVAHQEHERVRADLDRRDHRNHMELRDIMLRRAEDRRVRQEVARREQDLRRREEELRVQEERAEREGRQMVAWEEDLRRREEKLRVREEREEEERRQRLLRDQLLRSAEIARQIEEEARQFEPRQEENRPREQLLHAPPNPPPPAPQNIVLRKPLTICYTCLEPIARLEDAEWCRAQCGQNICNECFEAWHASQPIGRVLKCGFCRAVWRWERERG